MFPACAVTRAMSKKVTWSKSSFEKDVSDCTMVDLSDTFIGDSDFGKPPELTSPLKTPKVCETVGPLKEKKVPTVDTLMSRKQMIAKHASLSSVFVERRSLIKFMTEMVF